MFKSLPASTAAALLLTAGPGLAESTGADYVRGLMKRASDSAHPELVEGMQICTREKDRFVPHKEGYNRGQTIARVLNAVENAPLDLKPGSNQVTGTRMLQSFKTRAGFASVAVLAMQKQGHYKVAGCYAVYSKPLQEQAWSSLHSGLTDHLSPPLKSLFFSYPER